MLEYNVTRDDFESDEDWTKFIFDLNSDVNSPYYGTANVTGSYALRPGYILSFYQRGSMDALALQEMFNVIDPNDNLFPSLLEQNGLTDQYNSDVEFLSEVNRWLAELEIFLRGDQGEDDDGRFRAIEAREWRELLEDFKDGDATVRQVRDFFDEVSYLPELDGWNDYVNDITGTSPFRSPRTWEEVKRVLESNGYTPEEIQSVKDSIRAPGGEFQGSIVLPGILRDLGYDDAGWWDVRPAAGQPCEITGGFGTYDADGNCQDSGLTGQEGDPCGYGGVRDEYGNCINQDYSCDNELYASNNPGECGDSGETDDEYCAANPDDPECVDKGFSDYAEEVGEDVANTAKGIYDEFKDTITECVDGPLDCIKKIGDVLAEQGLPEECVGMEDPFFCTEKSIEDGGKACWKDCVNFSVLSGLPIPIPMPPGMVDVGTYRDFENGLKKIGKTIGDIVEGNADCGPDNDQECTFGQVLTDLKDWVLDNVQDAMDGISDYDLDDAYDWLKGILGSVFATVIWEETKDEVADVIGVNLPITGETKECPDPANPGQTITVPADQECPEVPVDNCETSQFGCCEDGTTTKADSAGTNCEEYTPDYGMCDDGLTPKEDAEGTNCPPGEPIVNENDPCELEDGKPGTYQYVGDELQCIPDDDGTDDGDTDDGTDPICDSPRPAFDGSFDSQFAGREWDRACEETHCTDGTRKVEGFDCDGNPTGPQTCEEQGLQTDPETDQCLTPEDFCAKYPDAEGCATEDPEDPEPEEECTKPDGTPTGATPSSGCEQCPDGYTFDFDGVCQPDGGTIDCAQYNRETNEDGTCGGCLPGFQKDTTLPNEPCVQIFDGCPAGFELVNGECTAIQCPEGQSYCESTGQCEEPQNCPGGPSEGGSGGGGGGGGFAGLNIQPLGIEGDPQLLGRQRFGQQDFLTPLFTGNQGGGADFPIARFLQGKGDIV
jgi:hypothetical protein